MSWQALVHGTWTHLQTDNFMRGELGCNPPPCRKMRSRPGMWMGTTRTHDMGQLGCWSGQFFLVYVCMYCSLLLVAMSQKVTKGHTPHYGHDHKVQQATYVKWYKKSHWIIWCTISMTIWCDYLTKDISCRTTPHGSIWKLWLLLQLCVTIVGITYEDNHEGVDYISTYHFHAHS